MIKIKIRSEKRPGTCQGTKLHPSQGLRIDRPTGKTNQRSSSSNNRIRPVRRWKSPGTQRILGLQLNAGFLVILQTARTQLLHELLVSRKNQKMLFQSPAETKTTLRIQIGKLDRFMSRGIVVDAPRENPKVGGELVAHRSTNAASVSAKQNSTPSQRMFSQELGDPANTLDCITLPKS